MSEREIRSDTDPVEQTQPDRTAEPIDGEQSPRLDFVVVGIGASAGGLEACIEFFDAMPADSGIAFVVVLHLAADRESMITDIFSKHTKMQVQQAKDGMEVKQNQVFVIPPGHSLAIKNGELVLGELREAAASRPIDDFFRSLAAEQRERAVCIVLSGMGSDGTAGVGDIKAVGGVAIAQEPESAAYPSMPRHLLDSGNADYVRRPEEMPDVLVRYTAQPYVQGARNIEIRRDEQRLNEIIAVLHGRTRRDYSGYKKPTLIRRIERRMGLNDIKSFEEYTKFIRQNTAESMSLSDDLMIHVTGFFRDPEAWDALREKKVIAPLIDSRQSGDSIRCWVTACSSGEEAYTLAMLLDETAFLAGKSLDIKVFATDLAERTLAIARSGTYPTGIDTEISPRRIERYFIREDAIYRVKKELRDIVIFAPQNLIQDPPYSRLDICTCRNLFIYLEPDLQARVLALLHFGLREGGVLFLGISETIIAADEIFEPIDKRARIFRRVGPTQHGTLDFVLPTGFNRNKPVKVFRDETARKRAEMERAELLVLEQSARREAEKANSHKDQFLATVSHELRTPLSAILMWAKMLNQGMLGDAEKREASEVIERSADLQRQLLDDLIETSRITSGKVRLELTLTDLAVLIRRIVETSRPIAEEKGVSLETDVPDVERILVDPARITQILNNLLTNAIKFTPRGGKINLRLRLNDGWAKIQVSDTGEGIDPAFLPQVFTPFSQADPGKKRSRGGLGLGLAICRELVELHGGTINAESAGTGQGTTFTFELPVHAASQVKTKIATDPAEDRPNLDVVRNARLLLIEDDAATSNAVAKFLQKAGIDVTAVGTAAAAMAAFEMASPDIIVSDIALPEEDGYELLRGIRAREAARHMKAVPAIALTAFAGNTDYHHAREAGFHLHLAKPANPTTLLNAVARLLSEARAS